MLEESQIKDAYLGLLGRLPESDEVIQRKRKTFFTYAELLTNFINSEEFLKKFMKFNAPKLRGVGLVNKIESEVDQSVLQLLLQRTIRQWTNLGDSEPYWSVLTSSKFELDTFESHSEEFWSSGSEILGVLDRIEREFRLNLSNGTCIELGCGVGRMTWFLANRVRHMNAVDISAGNLAIANSRLNEQRDRCELVHLTDLEELKRLPTTDLFLSFIALQHNSPPVQAEILKICLAQLKIGGIAVFQVVVGAVGYEFESKQYLASVEAQMEMHCLPISRVLEICADGGIKVSSIEPDNRACDFGLSMTFIGQRVW